MFYLLLVILLITILTIVLTTGIYIYTFYHPLKNRFNPLIMSEDDKDYYGDFTDEMLRSINEITNTKSENVFIKSFDGLKLNGHLFNSFTDRPIVIFFHGYHGSYLRDGYGTFRYCMSHNLNLLMVEQRAHCQSEGNLISFGINERKDAVSWVEYVKSIVPEGTKIILSGVSMGAATIMMASDLLESEPQVLCFIEDCGYTSPEAIIRNTAGNMNKYLEKCYPLSWIAAKLHGHFNLNSASAIESVSKITKPILFIHGSVDTFVPTPMCETLFNACSSKTKKMKIIPDAKHAIAALVGYTDYEKCINDFLGGLI